MSSYPYLPLSTVEEFVPAAGDLGPQEKDFLGAYRDARGEPDLLSDRWDKKRALFISQAMARARVRKEPLWEDGEPTPLHLALIVWAYSPHPKRVIG